MLYSRKKISSSKNHDRWLFTHNCKREANTLLIYDNNHIIVTGLINPDLVGLIYVLACHVPGPGSQVVMYYACKVVTWHTFTKKIIKNIFLQSDDKPNLSWGHITCSTKWNWSFSNNFQPWNSGWNGTLKNNKNHDFFRQPLLRVK